MYPEILSPEQVQLLPLLKEFRRNYCLVGGTAIALYIGHRRSLDFDLFTNKPLDKKNISDKLYKSKFKLEIIRQLPDQSHYMINKTKLTFFEFPYTMYPVTDFKGVIKLPALIDLGAMKAFALGGRTKWKDYVDLYFILKNYYTLKQISERAKALFPPGSFNEKLFRQQLVYYKDVNYSEEVEYLPGFETTQKEIEQYLEEVALASF